MIKVFRYFPELDAFLCTPEFKEITSALDLIEWTPVVWMGRLFARDEDFGEHWHDNWDERQALEAKGIPFEFPEGECWETLLIVSPSSMTATDPICYSCRNRHRHFQCSCGEFVSVGADGPCTSDVAKKLFWTDVLKSLMVSLETLIEVAKSHHGDSDISLNIDMAREIYQRNANKETK